METYLKHFFGEPSAVEAAIRQFDKIFRHLHNVYGGHRENTFMVDGEYNVVMSYTGYFHSYSGILPEFSATGMDNAFYHKILRNPEVNNQFYCTDIRKVDNLEAWRKGL